MLGLGQDAGEPMVTAFNLPGNIEDGGILHHLVDKELPTGLHRTVERLDHRVSGFYQNPRVVELIYDRIRLSVGLKEQLATVSQGKEAAEGVQRNGRGTQLYSDDVKRESLADEP